MDFINEYKNLKDQAKKDSDFLPKTNMDPNERTQNLENLEQRILDALNRGDSNKVTFGNAGTGGNEGLSDVEGNNVGGPERLAQQRAAARRKPAYRDIR